MQLSYTKRNTYFVCTEDSFRGAEFLLFPFASKTDSSYLVKWTHIIIIRESILLEEIFTNDPSDFKNQFLILRHKQTDRPSQASTRTCTRTPAYIHRTWNLVTGSGEQMKTSSQLTVCLFQTPSTPPLSFLTRHFNYSQRDSSIQRMKKQTKPFSPATVPQSSQKHRHISICVCFTSFLA